MSRQDGNSIKWLIPISPTELAGPFAVTDERCLEVCADIGKAVIARFFEIPTEITWFGEFEFMYCQRQHDQETIKVIRKATAEECRLFRVPIWIQGDDIPQCCGKAMLLLGRSMMIGYVLNAHREPNSGGMIWRAFMFSDVSSAKMWQFSP